AGNLELLYRQRGQQTYQQNRNGDRRHMQIEVNEVPLHDVTNQQVLRLANDRGHAAHCGADARMHHDITEQSAELLQVRTTVLLHRPVVIDVVVLTLAQPGHYPVIDAVETRSEERRVGKEWRYRR